MVNISWEISADRCCVVVVVQYLFNPLYYVIWHLFPTSRHYRFLLNVWFIDIVLTRNKKKTTFTCRELRFCNWTVIFIILSCFRGIAPFTSRIGKNSSLRILKGPTGDRTHEDFERSISICSYIFVSPKEKKLNPMNNHVTDLQRVY